MYVYVSASHAFWQLITLNDNHHPYLLGTFRSMDNTCIINLTYSLKSQFDINPIWRIQIWTQYCVTQCIHIPVYIVLICYCIICIGSHRKTATIWLYGYPQPINPVFLFIYIAIYITIHVHIIGCEINIYLSINTP